MSLCCSASQPWPRFMHVGPSRTNAGIRMCSIAERLCVVKLPLRRRAIITEQPPSDISRFRSSFSLVNHFLIHSSSLLVLTYAAHHWGHTLCTFSYCSYFSCKWFNCFAFLIMHVNHMRMGIQFPHRIALGGQVKTTVVAFGFRSQFYDSDCLYYQILIYILYNLAQEWVEARGSVVVKALCCKPEGRGFKSRWDECFKLA
jgi:hypothetical protein